MSRFTSIKIKLNENDHMQTLLAEYNGNCDIKVWILDGEGTAWIGELSTEEAQQFITNYQITKEIFVEELCRALTSSDPEVIYSIDKNETKGYVFSWKKCLDTGIIIKNGEMTLEKVSSKDVFEEIIERSFEQNSQLQSQVNLLQKEKEDLFLEKETVLSSFETVVKQKEDFERNVYSQFLSVLNAKKERILDLQESLDRLMQIEGPSSSNQDNQETKRGTTKREVKQETKKEDAKRGIKKEIVEQEVPKSSVRSQQEKEDNEVTSTEEQSLESPVDPYEVDTDIEDEVKEDNCDTPVVQNNRNKRYSKDELSQSFSLSSFEEISSPVPLLPKRSKIIPKEEVKRNLATEEGPSSESAERMETGEDLADQF